MFKGSSKLVDEPITDTATATNGLFYTLCYSI